MKPRVHSQPSPTAPVWLSHRKLGFLYSLLSHSPCMTICIPLSFFLYVLYVAYSLLCFSLLSVLFFVSVCIGQSASLSQFLVFFFPSCSILTNTHTHKNTTLSISLPVSLSQPADWFSRRGSARLHKHMALNLPSCVCWNGTSFSMLFKLAI